MWSKRATGRYGHDVTSAFEQDTVTQLTSADGEPVALHDFGGRADGPPLLLGHGNGLNAGMWAAAIPHLAERFHCYGVDLRGHGQARAQRDGYAITPEAFAADITAAATAIGRPVCYAAHSLGAATGTLAALDNPELFAGLFLFEPVLIPDGFEHPLDGPALLVELARRRRVDFDSIEDAVTRFRSKPPFAGCDERAVAGYVEVGTHPTPEGVRLSCRAEDEARTFAGLWTVDFSRLQALQMPVMVVAGGVTTKANSLPPLLAAGVAQAIAGARLVELDGISHFGPMEDPLTIARLIVDFFSENGQLDPTGG